MTATATVTPTPSRPPSPSPVRRQPQQRRTTAESARPAAFSPLSFASRHWLYLMFCLLASGAAAYHASERFTVLKYNFETQLLYNRVGSGAIDYEAPWLTALTPIVTSRNVLDGVRNDLAMDISLENFEEVIDVEVPYESSLFRVSLQWPEQDRGEEILDRLIGRFMEIVAMTRNASVELTSSRLVSNLNDLDHRLQSAREQMHSFNARVDVLDFERDLDRLRAEIELLEKSLGTAKQRNQGRQAQLEALTIVDPQDSTPSESQKVATKNSSDLQRWRVLRDLVSAEERRIQQQATIEFQEKEFERAKKLHDKKYISDAEFDALATKMKTLKSVNDPALQNLREQLEAVERKVPLALKSGILSAAMFSSSSNLRAGVELSLIDGETQVNHLEQQLEQKRQRMSGLIEARMEAQSLSAAVQLLSAEWKRLQQRLTDLQSIKVAKPIEFSVIQSAAPALRHEESNIKKLLVGVFGGCMLVLVGPLLLFGSLAARHDVQGVVST